MTKKKFATAGPIFNHPAVTVASYFVFQGMRYMTPGERTYKISLTCAFAFLMIRIGLSPVIAVLAGHALNFVVNGQLPVLMRYVVPDIGLTRSKVEMAFDKIKRTASKFGILDVLIFGSFSRGAMKSSSDLDLRLYHRSDPISAILAYSYATWLRAWGNWTAIPLDVYCFSRPNFLDRMRADENPSLLLYSCEMRRKYPNAQDPNEMLERNEALH